jgi:alpha-D-ribose 1-methylphosphonate 5-triphosphate synthase subunit PhnG
MDSVSTIAEQQRWMKVLAAAGAARLEEAWASFAPAPAYRLLRPVEIGLVLLRGRIGGDGRAFPFGEATVTRAAVALTDETRGFAYLLGRRPREAELAALCHALLKQGPWRTWIEERLIRPAEAEAVRRRADRQARAATTRVDFETVVRGE